MPEALYEGVTSALVAPFSCRQENKKARTIGGQRHSSIYTGRK
uniref:Uncharacterized protein n=1 Tax=Klebsiella pneumoniae TaxID=573 RepID=A0A3G1IEA1_KLEPN|nr:hypothetical protein pPUTH1_0252 [Klebsiella pneumoniae]QJX11782.1 hypothetical protein [Klebsiella pneumoniae]